MMKINGQEISFDIDNKKDNARLMKAAETLLQKNKKARLSYGDMETFLMGCIKEQELTELLKDNRVSTLTKVFADFYSQAIDQLEQLRASSAEANDIIKNTNTRATEISKELDNDTSVPMHEHELISHTHTLPQPIENNDIS